MMRDFKQRKMTVSYRRFGAKYRYHLQGSSSLRSLGLFHPWSWNPVSCSETSITYYQSKLRNNSEESISCLIWCRNWSVKLS